MTPTQRAAAARLADELQQFDGAERESLRDEVAALLRELAAEPVQEPVAWIHHAQYLLAHAENSPPADKMLANGWTPLYTAPQQRRPLTDDEALALIRATPQEDVTQEGWIRRQRLSWVRAIERAHGITGEPT